LGWNIDSKFSHSQASLFRQVVSNPSNLEPLRQWTFATRLDSPVARPGFGKLAQLHALNDELCRAVIADGISGVPVWRE
jgi:hypothetical protein